MLGFPILYVKGMRITMFQLSGFYCSFFVETCLLLDSGFQSSSKLALRDVALHLGILDFETFSEFLRLLSNMGVSENRGP